MFSWGLLHRGIKAIFFVQIVNRLGDLVVPFLTLILTQVQGFSPAVAGLVVSLATALDSLGGLVSGRLGDRYSRRDVLVVFLGTSALLVAGVGFAPTQLVSAAVLVAAGFFFGAMRPVLSALVGDLAAPETRRSAYSLSYLGINIGVALGPLLAAWLFDHALNWLFWLDALSTAAALVVLVAFVPRRTHGLIGRDVPKDALTAFLKHPILPWFGLLFFLYHFVYSQMVFTLGLQLVALFGKNGPGTFGFVWALNAVVVVVITPAALSWTRRRTNLESMALGMIFMTLGTAIFLFHPDFVWVLVSAVLWTTGEVLFSIHMGDLVASQSPPALQGRFQAYVSFLGSLGFVVSPMISGSVAGAVGLAGVWWMATVVIAGVGVGFYLLHRKNYALEAFSK
jgi:MFS family permease